MAVEAWNLNIFPGQFVQDRQSMNPSIEGNVNPQMRFPFDAFLPGYQCFGWPVVGDSVPAKNSGNTDSGLTCNVPNPRKRQRDSADTKCPVPSFPPAETEKQCIVPSSFASGEAILPHTQQYQSEIDSIISQHNKKIRLEFEKRQTKQARLLAAAVGEGMMKKLREKDEQIRRIGKLNFVLQDRVKSLYAENQLWRELARTNEAAVNSLRTNLEQVLLHVSGGEVQGIAGGGSHSGGEDDAESCCGSSDGHRPDDNGGKRVCRMCGEREPCVLLLPCRHLCLCGACGGGSRQLQACPVCNSAMDATLHVNTTSS